VRHRGADALFGGNELAGELEQVLAFGLGQAQGAAERGQDLGRRARSPGPVRAG
jgi:hypothetical protein